MATRKTANKLLTNKTCKEISDLVLGYLRNELAASIRRDFRRHLKVCPDCVSFLNTYKKTIVITGTLEPAEMPPQVRANILQFLRKRMRQLGVIVLYCFSQVLA